MELNECWTDEDQLSLEKEMSHLKGFLQGKEYKQSILALNLAKREHKQQTRRAGGPYIMHPIRVCTFLTALKVYDDNVLAAALLHDVIEDSDVSLTSLKEKGFNDTVVSAVDGLTKKKGQSIENYYGGLISSVHFGYPEAGLAKLSDRCNNVSTMAGAFDADKIKVYITETETFVYLLCDTIKEYCPQYSDQVFVMRYNLESIIKAYKLFLNTIDKLEE